MGEFPLYQSHSTTSETRSRHSRAEDPGLATRNLHHCVQLGATHFVVVPQALVRFIHQPAEIFHPILFECSNRLKRPAVFIHHMRRAFPHQRVKRGSMPFEICRLYISQ